jgi:hypothetical protein
VLGATRGYPGAKNDKTIVRYDLTVLRIRNDAVYTQKEFRLLDAGGGESTERGVYLIVDGGYHKVRTSRCSKGLPFLLRVPVRPSNTGSAVASMVAAIPKRSL